MPINCVYVFPSAPSNCWRQCDVCVQLARFHWLVCSSRAKHKCESSSPPSLPPTVPAARKINVAKFTNKKATVMLVTDIAVRKPWLTKDNLHASLSRPSSLFHSYFLPHTPPPPPPSPCVCWWGVDRHEGLIYPCWTMSSTTTSQQSRNSLFIVLVRLMRR